MNPRNFVCTPPVRFSKKTREKHLRNVKHIPPGGGSIGSCMAIGHPVTAWPQWWIGVDERLFRRHPVIHIMSSSPLKFENLRNNTETRTFEAEVKTYNFFPTGNQSAQGGNCERVEDSIALDHGLFLTVEENFSMLSTSTTCSSNYLLFRAQVTITLKKNQGLQQRIRHSTTIWTHNESALWENSFNWSRTRRNTKNSWE